MFFLIASTAQFQPMKRDLRIEEKYGLFDKVVIGYVGSFVEYEGLDALLDSIAKIMPEVANTKLVGWMDHVSGIGIKNKWFVTSDNVIFTGRVPQR